jgi:hypothetical protein
LASAATAAEGCTAFGANAALMRRRLATLCFSGFATCFGAPAHCRLSAQDRHLALA